jgi:Zn-dependent protease
VTTEHRERTTTPGWVIGHVGSAPVVATPSLLLAVGVITFLFAPVVQARSPGLGSLTYAVALAFAVLLLGSVFLHELSHAVVARARGQQVRELTITVWGGRTSFETAATSPGTSALVAVVGPLTNIVVAAACWVLIQVETSGTVVPLVLFAGLVSNIFVAGFNLLPGLPMDGGFLLEALVWKITGSRCRGTLVAGWVGRVVVVLVVAWVLVLPLVEGRAPDLVTVAWAALIGSFLWSGAGESIRAARTTLRIGDLSLDQIGVPAVGVPATLTLAQGEVLASAAGAGAIVLMGPDGSPVGYVDQAAALLVPAQSHDLTPLVAVAVAVPPTAVIDARLTGSDLVRAVGAVAQLSQVVVAVQPGSGDVVALVRVQDVVVALAPPRINSRG